MVQIGSCQGLREGEIGSNSLIDAGFPLGMMIINVLQLHGDSVCTTCECTKMSLKMVYFMLGEFHLNFICLYILKCFF